jgi:hypothetical protein
MEDKGQMNEVIEQMKLMNVLLSKHDKREETKEYNATFRVFGPRIFFIFLLTMVLIVLSARDEVNKSYTPPMYNSPSQQDTKHSLLHREVADAMKS